MESSYKLCLLFISPARLIADTVSLAGLAEFIKYIRTPMSGGITISHHRGRNNYIHHLKSMKYIKNITAYHHLQQI